MQPASATAISGYRLSRFMRNLGVSLLLAASASLTFNVARAEEATDSAVAAGKAVLPGSTPIYSEKAIGGTGRATKAIGGTGRTTKAIGGTGRAAKAIGGTGRTTKAIGGTGRTTKAIGGTGRTTKAIGGTGRTTKAIGGTGKTTKAIGGTGRTNKAIGGTGRTTKAIGGTGRTNKAIGGTGRTAKAIGGTGRFSKSSLDVIGTTDTPLLRGAVEAWDARSRNLQVLGQRFHVDGDEQFAVGAIAVVEGSINSDGTVVADYVWTDSSDLYVPGSSAVVITGLITKVQSGSGRFSFGALTVDYTQLLWDGSFAPTVGMLMTVVGAQAVLNGEVQAHTAVIK